MLRLTPEPDAAPLALMEAPGERRTSFDEHAALEELERLHQRILWHRSQRRKAEAEFEQFVQSFKGGAAAPVSQDPAEAISGAPEPVPFADSARIASIEPEPSGVSASAAAVAPTGAPPLRWRRRWSGRRIGVSAAAAGILATGGFLAWTARHRAPERPASTPVVTGAAAPAALPESRPTRPAQPARPQSAITTIRPVWIRVIADGERIVEREVQAGHILPLAPERTLVVRAGDAGAVRMTIAGQDHGFLGRDGEVVTRTFEVPPPIGRLR